MAAGGRKERAEREERGEREGRASEARAATWLRPLATSPPPHHTPHSTASRPPPPLSTSPPHGPNHATRAPTTPSTPSSVHWRTRSRIPPPPCPRRPPHASRECAAARCSRTPTRRSHEPHGSQILYNLARGWPRAETGPVRTHVMPRILPEPGSQAPHTVHSSAFCSWRGGGPVGARQQLVCRLHRRVGAWADGWPCHPAPSHPPSQGGPGRIDRVTVDDHISASAGRRGGLWWRGQSERWVACSGPLTPVAGPAHHTHDAGRGQAHRPQLRVCSGAVLTHADPAVTRARWVERRRRRPARPVRVPMQK